MKKSLFYLLMVSCVVNLFSCNDDKKTTPPKVETVIATYSADKLKAEVDGVAAAVNAKVELLQNDDKSVVIRLFNIVPGFKVVDIPNATYEAQTKATYISKLTGEVNDNTSGYKISASCIVDEGVMIIKVELSPIEGELVSTKSLHGKVYKGKLITDDAGIPVDAVEQRIYITASKTLPEKRDSAMVKLQIKNFMYNNLNCGLVTLDTVLVQKRGEAYGFEATDRMIELQTLGLVKTNLHGAIVGDKMVLNITFAVNASDTTKFMDLDLDFNGKDVVENIEAKMLTMDMNNSAIFESKYTLLTTTVKYFENNASKLKTVKPVYTMSDKAKIDSLSLFINKVKIRNLALDETLDLTLLNSANDYYFYYISAEDSNVKGSHKIVVECLADKFIYSMTEWNSAGEPLGIANSNAAATFLPIFGVNIPKPVLREGTENVVRILTSRTDDKNQESTLCPAITAGTLFNGKFDLNMLKPLKSTKFGEPCRFEPKALKFTYKYTPGSEFYKQVVVKVIVKDKEVKDNKAELVPGKTDECSIAAYLYEVSSYNETLDGTNVTTSDKVIMKAMLPDGRAVADYTEMEINFTTIGNKAYDPKKLYKLAIVCSSSKEGDLYNGGPGSTLYIKHLEVVAK